MAKFFMMANFIFLQAKDERISALETENAMLYLKLAQLRGSLQSSREEVAGLHSQYESETKFRQTVIEKTLKFKQELDVCNRITKRPVCVQEVPLNPIVKQKLGQQQKILCGIGKQASPLPY